MVGRGGQRVDAAEAAERYFVPPVGMSRREQITDLAFRFIAVREPLRCLASMYARSRSQGGEGEDMPPNNTPAPWWSLSSADGVNARPRRTCTTPTDAPRSLRTRPVHRPRAGGVHCASGTFSGR